DGGRLLDELSTVVAADEEQVHFSSGLQHAPDFPDGGVRIGGPVKRKNAEEVVDRTGFQRNGLKGSVLDLDIGKSLNPAQGQAPHVLRRIDADESHVGPRL